MINDTREDATCTECSFTSFLDPDIYDGLPCPWCNKGLLSFISIDNDLDDDEEILLGPSSYIPGGLTGSWDKETDDEAWKALDQTKKHVHKWVDTGMRTMYCKDNKCPYVKDARTGEIKYQPPKKG